MSGERLDLLDGEQILLVTGGSSEEQQEVEAGLRNNPLWVGLDGVQSGQVKFAGPHWGQEGVLGYLAMLDDLERWYGNSASGQ
ncbi:MAG: hypothetical protein ACT4OM_13980 [Actinomycetota bacterium]